MTDIQKLIGQKWFLPLDRLAERTGIKRVTILRALRGGAIYPAYERKLKEFLESYQGEL